MTLRLVLVDDNAHFLAAARCLLTNEGIEVVAVASTASHALAAARQLRPDVVLVDVDLGAENGFDLAKDLSDGTGGDGQCVILTSAYAEDDLADLIETSPAVGFLAKSQLSAQAIFDLVQPTGATSTG
jgi:DNA-binding NarL/FixJ family response regulator